MSAQHQAAAPRGLPGPLPAGETILWQGGPEPRSLARHALHGRTTTMYFGAAAIFIVGLSWSAGRPAAAVSGSLATLLATYLAALALLGVMAWLVARTTVYTITTRRVVMRVGIALPATFNIPFASVAGADVRRYPDGTCDLPLKLSGDGRIAFLHLWPHARPWRVARPEPMLRCVPDGGQVAAILARALGAGPLGRAAAAARTAAAEPAGRSVAAA